MTTNWFNLDDDEPPRQEKVWTLADIYDDLGTKKDVARALDVLNSRIAHWCQRRERIRCPEPVRILGGAEIYSIEEWRAWFEAWKNGRRHQPRRFAQITVNAKKYGEGDAFFTHDRKEGDE